MESAKLSTAGDVSTAPVPVSFYHPQDSLKIEVATFLSGNLLNRSHAVPRACNQSLCLIGFIPVNEESCSVKSNTFQLLMFVSVITCCF
jgi:hypothetical protein